MSWDDELVDISIFKNLIFTSITGIGGDEICFTTDSGVVYKMYHDRSCCESVSVEDIAGDLNDLIGTPILVAEERTMEGDEMNRGLLRDYDGDGAELWTFYELRTIKGSVTIRWYGSSNGYYSVDVDLYRVK